VSPVRRVEMLCRQTGDTSSRPVKRSHGPSDIGGVRQTILVCDDEEAMRALMGAALDPFGCEIVEARDGDEALELARTVRPNLIVLDMMMPGRTGLEVLAELRRDAEFAGTPVIVLTARAQASDREAAALVGASQFITKPFSPRELCATVEQLLNGRR
jgi:two-component system response regulator MtrA